jgi:hypothetical protein
MRIDELVNAPDAQVYHWTNSETLATIFRTNVIRGDTEHRLDGQKLRGVSTSRNLFFDIQDTYAVGGIKPWCIGLNLQRLRYDHRVLPVRDEQYRGLRRNDTTPEPIRFGFQKVGTHAASSDEREEFIVGDVYPFWHYVQSLAVEERHIDITSLPGDMDEDGDLVLHTRSSVRHEDQQMLWRLVAGSIYGRGPWQKAMMEPMIKDAFRLPAHVPLLLIDRGSHRVRDLRAAYKDNMDFPDERPEDGMRTTDAGKGTRDQRGKMFDLAKRRAKGRGW